MTTIANKGRLSQALLRQEDREVMVGAAADLRGMLEKVKTPRDYAMVFAAANWLREAVYRQSPMPRAWFRTYIEGDEILALPDPAGWSADGWEWRDTGASEHPTAE